MFHLPRVVPAFPGLLLKRVKITLRKYQALNQKSGQVTPLYGQFRAGFASSTFSHIYDKIPQEIKSQMTFHFLRNFVTFYAQSFLPFLGATLGRQEQPSEGVLKFGGKMP